MGGVVDHSSSLPDPIAMSSAEAEYNEGCIAFMAANHLKMLLSELEMDSETTQHPNQFTLTARVPSLWETHIMTQTYQTHTETLPLCQRVYCI